MCQNAFSPCLQEIRMRRSLREEQNRCMIREKGDITAREKIHCSF